jgi:hypothetical protein
MHEALTCAAWELGQRGLKVVGTVVVVMSVNEPFPPLGQDGRWLHVYRLNLLEVPLIRVTPGRTHERDRLDVGFWSLVSEDCNPPSALELNLESAPLFSDELVGVVGLVDHRVQQPSPCILVQTAGRNMNCCKCVIMLKKQSFE